MSSKLNLVTAAVLAIFCLAVGFLIGKNSSDKYALESVTLGNNGKIVSLVYKIDKRTGQTWIIYPTGEIYPVQNLR